LSDCTSYQVWFLENLNNSSLQQKNLKDFAERKKTVFVWPGKNDFNLSQLSNIKPNLVSPKVVTALSNINGSKFLMSNKSKSVRQETIIFLNLVVMASCLPACYTFLLEYAHPLILYNYRNIIFKTWLTIFFDFFLTILIKIL